MDVVGVSSDGGEDEDGDAAIAAAVECGGEDWLDAWSYRTTIVLSSSSFPPSDTKLWSDGIDSIFADGV